MSSPAGPRSSLLRALGSARLLSGLPVHTPQQEPTEKRPDAQRQHQNRYIGLGGSEGQTEAEDKVGALEVSSSGLRWLWYTEPALSFSVLWTKRVSVPRGKGLSLILVAPLPMASYCRSPPLSP